VKKEYIITRQGKEFVLYEGLLDEAHNQGLKRISTTLIQIPHEDNANMAVVQAEVETERGIFSGIGDASPQNVNRMIVPHLLRMAETRAKARALRDAVNVGVTAVEELGDLDEPSEERASRESSEGYQSDFPKASPYKPASANQLATIAKLSRLLGQPEQPSDSMTSAEASERITELSREYNERKGASGRRSA
jgi:predicted amidohydrolase YtcJ